MTVPEDWLVSSIRMGPMLPFALMTHHSVTLLLCSDKLFTTPGLISNSYTVVLFVWGTDELEMGLVAKPDGLKEVQVELELLFGLVPIQASYAHL